jgi:hypothetical protein
MSPRICGQMNRKTIAWNRFLNVGGQNVKGVIGVDTNECQLLRDGDLVLECQCLTSCIKLLTLGSSICTKYLLPDLCCDDTTFLWGTSFTEHSNTSLSKCVLDFYNRYHCSTLYSEKIDHFLTAAPLATELGPALHHLNLESPLFL